MEPLCRIKHVGDWTAVTVREVIPDSGLPAGCLEKLLEQIPK